MTCQSGEEALPIRLVREGRQKLCTFDRFRVYQACENLRIGRRPLMDDIAYHSLEPEMLSTKRLAQALDCSPKTVQDWLYKDRKTESADPLPYYRLHGLVRFRLREVLAWIERRRVRAGLIFV